MELQWNDPLFQCAGKERFDDYARAKKVAAKRRRRKGRERELGSLRIYR